MMSAAVGAILECHWDAIVVGTGMGGGFVGRALADRGLSGLFVEKGRTGWRREECDLSNTLEDPIARSLRGAWPERIEVTQDGVRSSFFAPLGCGVGGSSVFYAATLERPEPADIDGVWPLNYEDMRPWFDRAEALLHVHGEPDPLSKVPSPELRPPPAPNAADAAIMAALRENGLHPYRLHSALRYLPGCAECLGRKCPRSCKMDGRSGGVEPALATGRATLLDRCEVTRLLGSAERVTGVEARWEGTTIKLRAERVIVAAGALSTPRLLLASVSEVWPRGCGNGSDLVGRNLMLHLNELFAVWPRNTPENRGAGPSKAVGLRDLMVVAGQRMGMVQALGVDAREPEILHALRQRLAVRQLGRSRLAHEGARVPARLAARALGTAKLFVGLLEDFPNSDNRVLLDHRHPSRVVAEYAVPEELETRRAVFRKAIRQAFRGLKPVFLNRAAEPNWGHPCGTTRMGSSPSSSVIDSTCRVHGIANLWISDASVFPTSFGVNPSLTVAANALRVADLISRGPSCP